MQRPFQKARRKHSRIQMSEFGVFGGLLAIVLGMGWIYSVHKNRQIRKLEDQNRDLAEESAEAIAEKGKAEQKADAEKASRELSERAYEAVLNRKEADTSSDTPLSEEDMKRAKDIMDNHSN